MPGINLGGMRCYGEPRSGHRALRKGRVSVPNGIYHLTISTAGHVPVFADPSAATAACRCFHDPALLPGARMLAWVLMPDHAHWLLQLGETEPLRRVVARLKTISAERVNECKGRAGPVWSRAYHDRALRDDEDTATVARYIIANPLRAGLAPRVGDYPYWNATWL
jgi:REP element-mobilizing transposase RayT